MAVTDFPSEHIAAIEIRLARRYYQRPYGHYKEEIYPLYCEYLAALSDGIRVLDVGAGPGHLTYEFYKRHPDSKTQFVLMDSWSPLLNMALDRLKGLGAPPQLVHRNYNEPGWETGLGTFDAIVSNNSIFNLKEAFLPEFYKTCFGLLKPNGLLLNQQSCGYETPNFGAVAKSLPDALAPHRFMTPAEVELGKRLVKEDVEDRRALDEFKSQVSPTARDGGGYASLHVPASRHVQCLLSAGFQADIIWRKMEFVVMAAVKGQPFPTAV
jgi:SAM-dependent methyltransferase